MTILDEILQLLRDQAHFRTSAVAILAIAAGKHPALYGVNVTEEVANRLPLSFAGAADLGVRSAYARSYLAEARCEDVPGAHLLAPRRFGRAHGPLPDQVIAGLGPGSMGTVEAKPCGTPEHWAHHRGFCARHSEPVLQHIAYGDDCCWVEDRWTRAALRAGPHLWLAADQDAPPGWTHIDPTAVIPRIRALVAPEIGQLIERVISAVYLKKWIPGPPLLGAETIDLAALAAEARAANCRYRNPSATALAAIPFVHAATDLTASDAHYADIQLDLVTGARVGILSAGKSIFGFVVDGPQPARPRVETISRLDGTGEVQVIRIGDRPRRADAAAAAIAGFVAEILAA